MAVNVAPVNRDLAGLTGWHYVGIVVYDRHSMPGIRPPHAAGTRWPLLIRVADDVIHLRLAEHFVDRDAKRIAAPIEYRLTHRLAGAH